MHALTAASMHKHLHKQHLQADTCKRSKHTRLTPEGVCTLTGKRLFPVGRLDKDSSGLMLVTNDGRLGVPCRSLSMPARLYTPPAHAHVLARGDHDAYRTRPCAVNALLQPRALKDKEYLVAVDRWYVA